MASFFSVEARVMVKRRLQNLDGALACRLGGQP